MPTYKTEGKYAGEFMASQANGERSRDIGTLISGQNCVAGTVLGLIVTGAATAAAVAGNTGNGVFGAVTTSAGVKLGIYRVIFNKVVSNAGEFTVEDPSGITVGEGNVGSVFTGGGVSFTIADGATDFVVGDSFTVTVAAGSGKLTQVALAGADGSQNAVCILYDNVDATAGDVVCTIVSRSCEVNGAELTYPTGASSPQIAAINAQLATYGIIVRKGL